MRNRLPSPAMLVALLALFVALGAGAYAATKAPKNSVTSKSIKNGQVSSKDLKDASVSGTDVADGSLNGADVADDSLTGADVADDSLTGADIANDSLTGSEINEASLDVPGEVLPISARLTAGTRAELVNVNGLELTFECGAAGGVIVWRRQDLGFFGTEGRSFGNLPNVRSEEATGETLELVTPTSSVIDEEATYRRSSDGATVTSDFTILTTDAKVGTDCLVMGNALASRG